MAMKRTLLELTQDILVSLDGDEVTSISDTTESASVASIVRQCFYEIAANAKLPEHYALFELTETSSSSPTIFTRPTDAMTIEWIKYDNALAADSPVTDYREVYFMDLKSFQEMMLLTDSEASDVGRFNYTIGSDSFPFVHITSRAPMYYTTYNDSTLVFDAYNSDEETFLRKTKTMAYGLKESTWTHSDSFVPPLDHKLSNYLFQKSKAQCFSELKQIESASAEKKARKAELVMNKEKYDVAGGGNYYYSNQLPNYGKRT
jgi:hypothetical protein